MLTWIFALTLLVKNVKIHASAQSYILACDVKDIVFTHEVKCVCEREERNSE